jgi:hypothetical protein
MSTGTSRLVARLVFPVALALLVGGCGGQMTTSKDTPEPSATLAPTTTGPGSLTAEERAWLEAIPKVHKKIDKTVEATTNLTPSGMRKLADTLRSCTRELLRAGPLSGRLQPVYAQIKKACREYDKGAACFATAASLGITFAGSPEDRKQNKAIDCGFAAQGKALIPLDSAETLSLGIQDAAG